MNNLSQESIKLDQLKSIMLNNLSIALLGVLLPPVAVGVVKGINDDFIINLVLTFVLPLVGGIIHAFHVFGVPILTNLLSLLLPPVSVLATRGLGADFLLNILLTLLADLPGIVHAYAIALGGSGPGPKVLLM